VLSFFGLMEWMGSMTKPIFTVISTAPIGYNALIRCRSKSFVQNLLPLRNDFPYLSGTYGLSLTTMLKNVMQTTGIISYFVVFVESKGK